MFLLTVKIALKRLWAFIRSHAKIIIIGVLLIVVGIMALTRYSKFRALASSLWGLIRNERRLYKQQVHELDAIRVKEVDDITNAANLAVETIERVEAEFKSRNAELDASQRRQIKRIVMKGRGDPDYIAREMSRTFGFTKFE